MMKKHLNLYDNEADGTNLSQIDEKVSIAAASQRQMTPLTKTVANLSHVPPQELEEEGTSEPADLNDERYKEIEDEADCDAISINSNLNRAVSEILKNRQDEFDDSSFKKRRQRLTQEQQLVLEQEFLRQPDWSRRGVLHNLSKRLGLQRSKIYKWNWDRKKKELATQKAQASSSAPEQLATGLGEGQETDLPKFDLNMVDQVCEEIAAEDSNAPAEMTENEDEPIDMQSDSDSKCESHEACADNQENN